MDFFKSTLLGFAICILISSCGNENDADTEIKKQEVPVVEKKITDTTSFANNVTEFDLANGPVGVYHVPEMLVLSITDSAQTGQVSAVLQRNFATLEEEMVAVGAEVNGPIGMITYNNSLKNFKFESTLFIKRIPTVQPKRCNIVVLEASQMLVYNFYGPYSNLFAAYDKIKKYCEKNDLIESGPMREFYITDPEKEKDPAKWLTRIMLPVISMRKK
ncbi:hypothetical protein CNR22_14475 [Sphingobacteriaceae bacterium]|nr:hypothetical protein CNR22_14475 [Sphingobacteriaceae bacterium]